MKRHSSSDARKRTGAKRERQSRPPTRATSGMMEWLKSLGIAFGLFLLFRTFLSQAYAISSGSMENSLLVGDYVMANKAIYGTAIPFTGMHTPAFRDPVPGDVVIFRPEYNDPILDVVKRVIAAPGDTVQMVERKVFRNGVQLEEPYVEPQYESDAPMLRSGELGANCCYGWQLDYLPEAVDRASYHPTRDNWGPLIVPDDHYLMLGDNRDQSLDSRYAGFIPRDVILGKASFIYFSVDRTGTGSFHSLFGAVRAGRVGRLVR